MTIKNGDLPANPISYDARMMAAYTKGEAIGLTKREYFAALAMQGLLVNMGRSGLDSVKQVADHAVCAADELLKELERTR